MSKKCPDDVPAVLKTAFSKQVLPKLKQDLAKWASILPATSSGWWNNFIKSLEEIPQPQTTRDELFPMLELKSGVQRPENQTQLEDLEHTEINMQLREKELAPLDKVTKFERNYKIFVNIIST